VVVVTDPASATDPLTLSVLCGTMPGMAATASPPPADYAQLLDDVQHRVRAGHAATMHVVNGEMQTLYRAIGRSLLERTRNGWSAEALEQMGADLRAQFPNSIAFSPSNLDYMRRFAEAWPDPAAAPPLEHLPWGHIRVLLDKISDPQVRDWYAAAAVRHGWSPDVLLHQIRNRTHVRGGSSEHQA
jgi:predicted nuclease of restriction endonuclease-like (RecB) superfamily